MEFTKEKGNALGNNYMQKVKNQRCKSALHNGKDI